MPEIKRTLSAANVQRLVDAYCGLYEYKTHVQDPAPGAEPGVLIPNPETRAQFANRVLTQVAFLDPIREWERRQKRAAALATVVDDPIDVT